MNYPRIGRFVAVSMVIVALPIAGRGLDLLGRAGAQPPEPTILDETVAEAAVEVDRPDLRVSLGEGAHGRSGVIWTRQVLPGEEVSIPLDWEGRPRASGWYSWRREFTGKDEIGTTPRKDLDGGDSFIAPEEPGVYHLEIGDAETSQPLPELKLIVKVPFEAKKGTHLRGYFMGRFPTEGERRRDRYATPDGFIEVTPESQNLQLSEHFKVREFLTKDQHGVWPKFVIIDPLLIEKLELVMQELNKMGVRAERMYIMSGFRTPQYNARGLNRGRASLSRHQYGDAADVWIDNDLNGYMDDLNGDGRIDTGDARVILEAVNRVEARYPELAGGAGVYRANAAHGPFLHIDVRGKRARW